MFVKRHYPIKNISYCAVDASDTRYTILLYIFQVFNHNYYVFRWDFSNVKYKDRIISVHNARWVHKLCNHKMKIIVLIFLVGVLDLCTDQWNSQRTCVYSLQSWRAQNNQFIQ